MAERKFVEVNLNGQAFKIYDGYTMAVLEAQTEAGGVPTAEMQEAWKKDGTGFVRYASCFVQSYFQLPPDFIRSCPVKDITAAFAAIMEATARDPFGQSAAPVAPEETQPTSGS